MPTLRHMTPCQDGKISCTTPVVISASRETDIPAFYSDWFVSRLREGWCGWQNTYSGIVHKLKGYTGKLVFSFIDIAAYRKVQRNLEGLGASEFPLEEQRRFARGLAELNKDLGLELATCGEEADLSAYGVRRNKCVDDELMMRLFRDGGALMNFIGAENDMFDGWHIPKSKKDKGQRKACGCIVSKDVGAYNTCPYLCRYCYANASPELALANWRLHRSRPLAPTITPENKPPGIPLANKPST